ncbi:MAG TPA: shikimate kinase [Acidimicrobiia bacterium]|nr:shikimate kinase [Acidimicrobiia bacterium]
MNDTGGAVAPGRDASQLDTPQPDSPQHLVLVGLMGAGKTTVGRRCAERMARPFVDTDELVEALVGRSVAEIFATDGEGTFRDLERSAVADACAAPAPVVIACGGGAVLDPVNRAALKARGFVVWLQAASDRLAARVGTGDDRPLLRGGAAREQLERLAAVRSDLYEAVADVAVTTDDRDVEQVVDAVLMEVDRCAA